MTTEQILSLSTPRNTTVLIAYRPTSISRQRDPTDIRKLQHPGCCNFKLNIKNIVGRDTVKAAMSVGSFFRGKTVYAAQLCQAMNAFYLQHTKHIF